MNCHQCSAALPANARFCPRCKTLVTKVPPWRVFIPEEIAKRAENFAGRIWVLRAVLDWLDTGQERFLLLTGELGCGKTALAAWLAGAGSTPKKVATKSILERVRDAWQGVHFCMAEEQRGTIDPTRFAQSLARQLSDRHDHYAEAVLQRLAPEIKISLQARENWGQMVGAQIENLIIGKVNVEDIYRQTVREPLEVLCKSQPNLSLCILVDALDEALTFGTPNIVTLLAGSGDLPAGIRFLLTSRNEDKVINQFKVKRLVNLSSNKNKDEADSDIRQYIEQRLAAEPLKQLVADSSPDIIDRLVDHADGNFLYVRFFLDDVATGDRCLASVEGLPQGLYGLYRTFLDRLCPEMLLPNSGRTWSKHYQPLVGCLSVAVPAAPLSLLPRWVGWQEGEVSALLNDLIQIIEYDPREGGGYRLYHRSMAEFLAAGTYEEEGAPKTNRYHTPPKEAHLCIIQYYTKNFQKNWKDCDPYGIRRLVSHIKACLDLEQEVKVRKKQAEVIFSVVLDQGFQQAQREKIGDPLVTLTDLWTAWNFALQVGDHRRAKAVANEALQVTETIVHEGAKALAMSEVAQALWKVGYLEKATEAASRALEVAKTIQYEGVKALALRGVVRIQVLVGNKEEIDRALDVVGTIRDEGAKALALSGRTQALALMDLKKVKETANWVWDIVQKGKEGLISKLGGPVPSATGEHEEGDNGNK